MISTLRNFRRATHGMAMVEFALTLPVLLSMFYGAIEVTRYILIAQKTEKLAHTLADVTAQSRTVTTANLNQLMAAAGDIMDPFAVGENSRIYISSLYRAPGVAAATVNWRYDGGGGLSDNGQLGAVGTTPTMPGSFTFNERENVIAAEVYYRFEPLLTSDFFGTTTVYRVAFYKPRLGLLTTAPS